MGCRRNQSIISDTMEWRVMNRNVQTQKIVVLRATIQICIEQNQPQAGNLTKPNIQ